MGQQSRGRSERIDIDQYVADQAEYEELLKHADEPQSKKKHEKLVPAEQVDLDTSSEVGEVYNPHNIKEAYVDIPVGDFKTEELDAIQRFLDQVIRPEYDQPATYSSPKRNHLTYGWQPNFSTEFQLELQSGTHTNLYERIQKWVSTVRKFRSQALDRGNLETFISGVSQSNSKALADSTHGEQISLGIRLKTKSFVGNSTKEDPQGWLLSLEHPEGPKSPRHWRTLIGITRLDEKKYNISVINQYWIRTDFQGEPPSPPEFSTPRIVRELLSSGRSGKWNILSGSTPMSNYPLTIDQYNPKVVADSIVDKGRRLALVVMSPRYNSKDEEPQYPLNPTEVGKLLGGLATVMVLKDNSVRHALSYLDVQVSPKDLPSFGWLKVYMPNGAHSALQKVIAYSDEEIAMGGEDILHRIHRTALQLALEQQRSDEHLSSAVTIRSKSDIARAESAHRLAIQREKYKQAQDELANVSKTSVLDQEESKEVAEMRLYIEMLEQENSSLSDNRSALSEINDELRQDNEILKEEIRSTKAFAERLKGLLKNGSSSQPDQSLAPPTNVREALVYIESKYPEKVEILEEARAGAKDMVDNNMPNSRTQQMKALKLIENMATILWQLRFEEEGFHAPEFKNRTGFDISMSDGPVVAKDPNLRSHREVIYEDKIVYAAAHTKSGRNPGDQIRIHFFFDEEKKKVIIAKVADHLPIGSSKANGDRA